MKKIYAYTSAACNYLPKVRLLVRSLRKYHPEIRVVLAMADQLDEPGRLDGEGWDEIISIEALDIPQWRGWAFTHDIVELSTAIKPFVLKALLSREDCEGVLYFDPDMVLFSALDDLLDRLRHADILLTPHQTRPETGLAQVMDNEISSLRHGVYNLGFLGVRASANGKAFADWWAERLYYFCRDEISNGLFTDQRWVDLAPALFEEVEVLRSSRFNLATWNITTRTLTGDRATGFRVDGDPLGFYHFTGFDSGAHRVMAGKYAAGNPAADALISWYEEETSGWRNDPLASTPWAFGRFADGTPINRAQRLIYRNRPDLQERFEDPFAGDAGDESTFSGWCRSSGARQYPDLLPEPAPDADWGRLTASLVPSLAPSEGELPGLRGRLLGAVLDPRQARALGQQTLRVVRREGFGGLWRRLRRLAGR